MPWEKGMLIRVAGDYVLDPVEPIIRPNGGSDRTQRAPYTPLTDEQEKRRYGLAGFLTGLLPEGPELQTTNLPRNVLVTVFEAQSREALAIHLVNAVGTLDVSPGTLVGHDDPIPFPRLEGTTARVVVRPPNHIAGYPVRRASYHDPDLPGAIPLEVEQSAGQITVKVAPSQITWYGLIEVAFERV